MNNSKVCINSVFVHGYFKVKNPRKFEKKVEKYTDFLAGNKLDIFFNVRSYTLKLKKNISFYLHGQNLRNVVQKHIRHISTWDIEYTTAKITNFQGSLTLSNCPFSIFHHQLLPFLFETLSVNFIGVGFETNTTTTSHMKPEAFLQSKNKQYTYLTLDLGANQKLKIQPSQKKKSIQISFVFTKFEKNLRYALKILQKISHFLENPQSSVGVNIFLQNLKKKCRKRKQKRM